jgi:uncharacterized protein YdiU (UPF0061 family)
VPRVAAPFAFDNTYARLPEHFYVRFNPVPVVRPGLIKVNRALAEDLGVDGDALETKEGAAIAAGNRVPIRSRWLMPDISSGTSFRGLATGGPSSWAKSSTAVAGGATFS